MGRPRDAEVDAALTSTALEMLLERGYEQMSVEALVKKAGSTRPAFYRRFSGLPDLVLRLLLDRFETQLDRTFNSGSLVEDLSAVQQDQLAFFLDPLITSALPGFLAVTRSDEVLREAFADRFLLPRRRAVAAILQRGVDRGEIAEPYDPDWICDLMTGPFLMRVQLPASGPLDDHLVEESVSAALSVLGHSAHTRMPR